MADGHIFPVTKLSILHVLRSLPIDQQSHTRQWLSIVRRDMTRLWLEVEELSNIRVELQSQERDVRLARSGSLERDSNSSLHLDRLRMLCIFNASYRTIFIQRSAMRCADWLTG